MECPFELPVKRLKDNIGTHYVVENRTGCEREIAFDLQKQQADYIVQAINSYEKIQVIISRLERNRNTERLNSEATKEPSKSFWRGQSEKSSEVIIWLEQALKEAEKE